LALTSAGCLRASWMSSKVKSSNAKLGGSAVVSVVIGSSAAAASGGTSTSSVPISPSSWSSPTSSVSSGSATGGAG